MNNNKKEEYMHKKYVNKYGEVAEIIEYNTGKDVTIKYEYGFIQEHIQISNLKNKSFISPYSPTHLGVGYIGEGKYKPTIDGVKTQAYIAWCNMLERCFGKGSTFNKRGYTSMIDEEWYNFQNFAEWYYSHIYTFNDEKMCLDKDLLIKGNTLYSPSTCCIVPNSINTLLLGSDSVRGKYPIGVSYREGHGYYARCNVDNKCIQIGVYSSPDKAFQAYKQFKEQHIKDKATSMKDVLPTNVYDALMRYEVEEDD